MNIMYSVMYKRPIIRPKKPINESPSPVVPIPGTVVYEATRFTVESAPHKEPPAPLWAPKESYPTRVVKVIPFHENINVVFKDSSPHRPSLKALVDAMRLDGFTDEQVKKTRASYAEMRRTDEKRQAELEKLFGKYVSKPVKKVLKVLKKNELH